MPADESGVSDAKDAQLREDRRLLGRLLGEVIREQVGEAMLERIESIRQTAVNFRRSEDDPEADTARVRATLEAQLDALDIEQTLHVVRAFSYFSHLLNIAEDAQQHRRRRAHAEAGAAPRPGSFMHALTRAREAGATPDALRAWFARARVSPVLTAHPTEVQRQSILDCEREIARLIEMPQDAVREAALRREILRLWLTSMLRLAKLDVKDEIANGLAYFDMTFFAVLPEVYGELEAALAVDLGQDGEERHVEVGETVRDLVLHVELRQPPRRREPEPQDLAAQRRFSRTVLWHLDEPRDLALAVDAVALNLRWDVR